jgi:hypothetical protein
MAGGVDMVSFWSVALARNEIARGASRALVGVAAPLVVAAVRRRAKRRREDQIKLRRRYGIDEKTPVRTWDADIAERLYNLAPHAFATAQTSGSTAAPKTVPYTRGRLGAIKRSSLEAAVQTSAAFGLGSPSIFALSGLEQDRSLSNLLLGEQPRISWARGFTVPSRYTGSRELAPLIRRYGLDGVRLWLMVLNNPPILYGTNPSTIALFLNSVRSDWESVSRLMREHGLDHSSLDVGARKVVSRVISRGWQSRMVAIVSARQPPSLLTMAPGLRCFCCWDGGYVGPFLDEIRRHLPRDRVTHVPMYALSTECLQTQMLIEGGVPHFLPIARGVLYEFLPEGELDDAAQLLDPCELSTGQCYTMVVSDDYGFRRYQTEDVFECVGWVGDVPDLRFRRRRGLAYSFTGEKLTGHQVEAACHAMRAQLPVLRTDGIQMTLVPDLGGRSSHARPFYRLLMAHVAAEPPQLNHAEVARLLELELGGKNNEFAAKRASGRLAPTRAQTIRYDRLAKLLGGFGDDAARGWETQFKLMPLYPRLWGELAMHIGEESS